MSKLNLNLPEMELNAIVKAGLFKNKQEAIREALNTFFAVKPSMKLEAAIELYKEGKVTLGRAAEISGTDLWSFKDILADRGIKIEVECNSKDELEKQL